MRINWGPFLSRFFLINWQVFVQKFSKFFCQISDPPKTIVHSSYKNRWQSLMYALRKTYFLFWIMYYSAKRRTCAALLSLLNFSQKKLLRLIPTAIFRNFYLEMIDVFFKRTTLQHFIPEYGVTKIWQILISFATFLDLHTTFGNVFLHPQWIYT